MEQEIWKDVPNYEGIYKCSNFGKVLSVGRFIYKNGNPILLKRKILKSPLNKQGYENLRLCKNGIKKNYFIHQLVGICFLNYDKSNKNLVINHIDGIRNNNNLNNLEIVTIRENCSVCFRKDRNTMTSKYTGVSKNKNRWEANIKINGKPKYIGLFKTEVDAFNAYQNELKKII